MTPSVTKTSISSGRVRVAALMITLAMLSAVACTSRAGKNEQPADTAAPVAKPGTVQASRALSVLDTVRAVIARNRLTTLDSACVLLEGDSVSAPLVGFTARERHGGSCAGDPGTAPRLFSITVDTLSWEAATDARSTTATMERLSRP